MRNLLGRSSDELRIIRNTPFARHGYRFNSEDLQSHFGQFSWYEPRTKDVTLTSVENENVLLIRSIEQNSAIYDSAQLFEALAAGEVGLLENSVFDDIGYDFIDTVTETTPLLAAITSGNASSVEYLLTRGANPDFRAPILGIDAFDPDAISEIYRNDEGDRVHVWIPSRQTDSSASIPLVLATSQDTQSIVELLLTYGAYAGMYLEEEEGPLLVALSREANRHIRLFLEFGADPNDDGTYDSALSAAEEPWVVELLLQYRADPTKIVGGTGYSALALAESLEKSGLLIDALESQRFDINHILIERSRDTILHILVHRYAESEAQDKIQWQQLIQQALDLGADSTLKNRDGLTPSDVARSMELPDLAESME